MMYEVKEGDSGRDSEVANDGRYAANLWNKMDIVVRHCEFSHSERSFCYTIGLRLKKIIRDYLAQLSNLTTCAFVTHT